MTRERQEGAWMEVSHTSKVGGNSTAGFHIYVLIPTFEVHIPTLG